MDDIVNRGSVGGGGVGDTVETRDVADVGNGGDRWRDGDTVGAVEAEVGDGPLGAVDRAGRVVSGVENAVDDGLTVRDTDRYALGPAANTGWMPAGALTDPVTFDPPAAMATVVTATAATAAATPTGNTHRVRRFRAP